MPQDILSGTFGIVIMVFTLVLFLLWFFLPFAIFGIKGRLDQLIQQNKALISLLQNTKTESTSSRVNASDKEIGSSGVD
jgi:hypothetical protein